jgi:E1A-binding protein p400
MQSVSPVRKRLKLELETSEKLDVLDAGGYRRRIMEHKMRRLPALREKYVDTLSELFFLQSGGNMMDYHSWQKRPPIPQYLHFLRQHRLDPDDDNEDLTKPLPSISEFSQSSTVTTAAATTTTTTTITSIAVAGLSTTTLATTTVTSTVNSSQNQNAEVKISGVGVTPVAISTTLPAAVAQLNQQGKFLFISLVGAILIVMKKEAVSEIEIRLLYTE